MKRSFGRAVGPAALAIAVAGLSVVTLRAQCGMGMPAEAAAPALDPASCDDLLPPLREVKGKKVGPSSCVMLETSAAVNGKPLKRIDIGLDGTVDGYVTKTGDFRGYLTNSPDLTFPQTGDPGPYFLAFATYLRSQGAGMTIFYPADAGAWNGKMWVMVHGRGTGIDHTWDEDLAPGRPRDPRSYAKLMAAKGYVVVETHRVSNALVVLKEPPAPTGVKAVLEDGTPYDWAAFNDTARYIMDFTVVAETLVQRRLGKPPARTYMYGHSAGARIIRGINYTPGLNKGPDGKPMYDAFFADDVAAGTWFPIVKKDGKDVLFMTDAEKATMVPQLEVAHQGYNNIWAFNEKHKGKRGAELGVTNSYLANKRFSAKMARDKGLTPKYRAYEVRGISHQGSGPGLDVSPMWDRFIDMVDAWADKGIAPPPSRSDWPELGDTDRDGVVDKPGLAFPQIACPLGVYYPTTSTSGNIAFAAFTGQGLEPLDRNNVFVDMNRNGIWDFRETPKDAWVRLGLLAKGQELTREKYVACVQAAAEALGKDGFFSKESVDEAVAAARKADLQPKEAGAVADPDSQ
jgi:hypothetical protein